MSPKRTATLIAGLLAAAALPAFAGAHKPVKAHAPKNAPAAAPDPAAIKARYDTLQTALKTSDAAAVRKLMAPGFQGRDLDGAALTPEAMIASVHPAGGPAVFALQLGAPQPADGGVRVQRIVVIPDADNTEAHQAMWGYASSDLWIPVGGVWQLQSAKATWAIHLVDHAAVERKTAPLQVADADADPSLPDMAMGDPKAKVTVIEYGSVACPVCAVANQEMMPAFLAKYVVTGKVRYIYRPMETGNIAVARQGHALAECAGRDQYFHVVDAIMRAQPEMDKGGQPEQYANAPDVLKRIGHDAGLTPQAVDTCLADKDRLAVIDRRNAAYIDRDGVSGTPTFLVNGHEATGNLRDPHMLDATIDALLK